MLQGTLCCMTPPCVRGQFLQSSPAWHIFNCHDQVGVHGEECTQKAHDTVQVQIYRKGRTVRVRQPATPTKYGNSIACHNFHHGTYFACASPRGSVPCLPSSPIRMAVICGRCHLRLLGIVNSAQRRARRAPQKRTRSLLAVIMWSGVR